MIRLLGKPLEPGMALGIACVMRAPNLLPPLPAHIAAQRARVSKHASAESMEVILCVQDYETVTDLSLPWARVVGIAAERVAERGMRRGVPVVVGIQRLLESAQDAALALIDGDRGVVLIDPDGAAVATYQAEHDRLAPRRRLYLNYAHQTARTQDGREIHVLARVETMEEAQRAIGGGADALYAPAGSHLLPTVSDDETLERLLRLGEAAAGKPITLAGGLRSLPTDALLRAATHIDLTLAAPLSGGAESFVRRLNDLQERQAALLMAEIPFADLRMAGSAVIGEPLSGDLADYRIGRIVVEMGPEDSLGGSAERWLHRLIHEATGLLLPVEVVLPSPEGSVLETALGLGASGFIVRTEAVQEIKERVRSLDARALRSILTDLRAHNRSRDDTRPPNLTDPNGTGSGE